MTLAIIDGDVLAYQACYSLWERALKILGKNDDEIIVTTIDEHGNKVLPELSKDQQRKLMEQSWESFNLRLNNLLDTVYAEDYLMAVGGEGNYRKQMYPEYKLQPGRKKEEGQANIFVPAVRELAVMTGMAVDAHGREADDLIRIWANEAEAAGDPYIVCSIDKDLRCIAGNHYICRVPPTKYQIAKGFNVKPPEFLTVSKEDAVKNYYEQLLKGDLGDNIPGVPGMGPKTATKIIEKCLSETEMQEAVVSYYLASYKDDWYNMFLSNAKMIHIQRNLNDYFSVEEWPIVKELI
jgi:5'-3' exonuclease